MTAAQSTDEWQHPACFFKGVSQLLHDESSIGDMDQNRALSPTVGHSVERAGAQQLPSIRRRHLTRLLTHEPIGSGGSHAHIRMRPRHGAAAPLLLSRIQSGQESFRSHAQLNPAQRVRFPTGMVRRGLISAVDDVEQHRRGRTPEVLHGLRHLLQDTQINPIISGEGPTHDVARISTDHHAALGIFRLLLQEAVVSVDDPGRRTVLGRLHLIVDGNPPPVTDLTLTGRRGGDSWRKASEESLDLGDAFSEAMGGGQHRGQYPCWSRRPFGATVTIVRVELSEGERGRDGQITHRCCVRQSCARRHPG